MRKKRTEGQNKRPLGNHSQSTGFTFDDQLLLNLRKYSNTQLKVSFKLGGVPLAGGIPSLPGPRREAAGPSERIVNLWGNLLSGNLPLTANQQPTTENRSTVNSQNSKKSHHHVEEEDGLEIETTKERNPVLLRADIQHFEMFVERLIEIIGLIPDYGPHFGNVSALPKTISEAEEFIKRVRRRVISTNQANSQKSKREKLRLDNLNKEVNKLRTELQTKKNSQLRIFRDEPSVSKKLKREKDWKVKSTKKALNLQDFNILSEIGKGSFGLILLVEEKETHQKYVLKKVLKNGKITKEIEIHKKIEHDHIIQCYSSFEDTLASYLILEYAEKGSLLSWLNSLAETRLVQKDEVRRMFYQTCLALEYLHNNDIMHGDIKPENILLDGNLNIKLADFDCASQKIQDTSEGRLCGTTEYMAPEIRNSYGPHDYRVDIWALGVLLYLLLEGELPFPAEEDEEEFKQFNFERMMPLKFSADLEPTAIELICGLLQLESNKRLSLTQVLEHPWMKRWQQQQQQQQQQREKEDDEDQKRLELGRRKRLKNKSKMNNWMEEEEEGEGEEEKKEQAVADNNTVIHAEKKKKHTLSLKDFEFLGALGEGAFGDVNLVCHLLDNKYYALKMVEESKQANEEIRIHGSLDHKHIIRFYESFRQDTLNYLLLEYAENGTLHSFIYADEKQKEKSILKKCFMQLCEAVEYLHQHDIMHGDIKPENVLIDGEFNIKLADFGCASREILKQRKNRPNGDWAYMAPEIRNTANQPHDFQVDIWSLGAVLFEMIHRKRPYRENGKVDFKKEQLKISEEVESEAKNLMLGLLQIQPQKRISLKAVLGHPWLITEEEKKVKSHSAEDTEQQQQNAGEQKTDDKHKEEAKIELTKEGYGPFFFSSSSFQDGVDHYKSATTITNWKIVSWNIGSLKEILKHTYLRDFLTQTRPDILFLLETRMESRTLTKDTLLFSNLQQQTEGYSMEFNCGKVKGHYGAILVLTKVTPPFGIQKGMGDPKHDAEGRIITLRYSSLSIIGVYAPRAASVDKISARTKGWDPAFLKFVTKLKDETKANILIIGDLNISHTEQDISDTIPVTKRTGCTQEERTSFNNLLSLGFVDTFRYFNPTARKWSQINPHQTSGRRLDYALLLLVTETMRQNNKRYESRIRDDIKGSDHYPIEIDLSF